jgi:hypothetical protein
MKKSPQEILYEIEENKAKGLMPNGMTILQFFAIGFLIYYFFMI